MACNTYNPVNIPLSEVRVREQLLPTLLAHDQASQWLHLWNTQEADPPAVVCQYADVPWGSALAYQMPFLFPATSTSLADPRPFVYPVFDPITIADPTHELLYTSLIVSDDESRQYEIDTHDQAKCPQWFRLRESRITASNFKLVTRRTVRFETLACKLLQKSSVKTPAMEYGTLHEDEAAQQYSATYNITLYPVGFVINPSRSYLGCSPDRRVRDNSNEADPVGLLEVKCTMKDSVADVAFLKDVGGRLQLQRSHPYYEQCMGQMGLTGVKWCDFYVWCESDCHCERIAFDSSVFGHMLTKLDSFFLNYFLPALAAKKV